MNNNRTLIVSISLALAWLAGSAVSASAFTLAAINGMKPPGANIA